MSVTMTDDVTRYVDAVREALSDLPVAQRDELLEDLSQHLGEVAAEAGAPLSVRLGSPAAYAEELRTSIGLTAPAPPAGRRVQRLAAGLAEARDAVVDHPTGRAVLAFLPELRPGWWVLRGYLFVEVPSVLFDYTGRWTFPWPTVLGSRPVGLLATLAAIVASVVLGRRTVRDPGWRRLVVVGNTLLVLAALVAFGSGRVGESVNYSGPAWSGYLTGPDGRPITNVFPFAADGRPLTGVRLYDQDGRPIDNVGYPDYAGGGFERRYPTDAYGNQVTNAYPLEQSAADAGTPPQPGTVPTAVPPLVAPPTPFASPLPSGSQLPFASPLPSGSMLPSASPLPSGSMLPSASPLPSGSMLPSAAPSAEVSPSLSPPTSSPSTP